MKNRHWVMLPANGENSKNSLQTDIEERHARFCPLRLILIEHSAFLETLWTLDV
jgi:hypothetical protein